MRRLSRFPLDAACRWHRTLVAILLALFGEASGRDTRGGEPAIPDAVDRVLRQRVEYGYNLGVVVGIVNRDGRTVRGYGWRDGWRDDAVDGGTIFEIGSITKLFTAALLADAAVRGEVGLEDPVQSLLPETVRVPRGNEEIRLVHLATHRSGLPTIPDNLCSTRIREPFACYDVDRMYEFLGRYRLPREPGAAWEYSNIGFGLLGHVLARRAGLAYEGLLRERILDPLGLSSIREVPLPEQRGRVASGYSGAVAAPPFRMAALEGAGVLRSTSEDLLDFLAHNLGFRESPASAALRETHRLQGDTVYPGVSIGLGWLRVSLAGGQVLFHDGETPGFTAFIGFHPAAGLGVTVLSNARVNDSSGITDVGFHLLDSSYPLTAVARPAVVPGAVLAAYPGVYRGSDGEVFELGLCGDRLVLYHVNSDFEFTLYPQSNTRFAALELELGANASARFSTNSTGAATRLDWTQNGRTLAYTRHGDPARVRLAVKAGEVLVSVTGGGDARYDVQASSDLRDWEPIGSVMGGAEGVADPGAAGQGKRFYRAMRQR